MLSEMSYRGLPGSGALSCGACIGSDVSPGCGPERPMLDILIERTATTKMLIGLVSSSFKDSRRCFDLVLSSRLQMDFGGGITCISAGVSQGNPK